VEADKEDDAEADKKVEAGVEVEDDDVAEEEEVV